MMPTDLIEVASAYHAASLASAPGRHDPRPTIAPAAAADYIHDLSRELARMATDAGLDLLAYLLDMVQIEAELVAKRMTDGDKPDKGR